MRIQTLRPIHAFSPPRPPQPQPDEPFYWDKAMALPAYTFGPAAGALAGLSAYSDAFPPGGITINPGGVHLNPEFTRHFQPGTTLRQLTPLLAIASTGVHLVRGGFELERGLRENDQHLKVAGALDLGIAATSALTLAAPAAGGISTLALGLARGVWELA